MSHTTAVRCKNGLSGEGFGRERLPPFSQVHGYWALMDFRQASFMMGSLEAVGYYQ